MKKSLLTISAFIISLGGAFAQYYFIKTVGTSAPYTMNPTSATSIIAGSGTATSGTLSSVQQLPWSFDFYGIEVQDYKVSTSGYLTFQTTTNTDNSTNVALPSASAPSLAIFAFWDNTRLQTITQGTTTFPSDIRSWTYGTAPNRVHVVQWRLVQTNDNSSAINVTYYAIRFYEGTSNFDIVLNYGFGTFSATVGCQNALGTVGTQVAGSPNMNFGGADGGYDPTLSDVYSFRTGVQPNFDVKLTSIKTNSYLGLNQPEPIRYTFTNNGAQNVTSFRANYKINGGETVSQNVTGVNVTGSGIGSYGGIHPTPFVPTVKGVTSIKFWIDNINGDGLDANNLDDTLTTSLNVFNATVKRKSLYEVFTSSTCPPCRPGNETLQEVFRQRMGGYTVIKYQYNFPGAGDPYYTTEGASRGTYYGGISSVPSTFIDGGWDGNPNGMTTTIFDEFYNRPTVVGITGSQSRNGNTFTMTAKVKPTDALPGNYKIHFAILERVTIRNIKTNGEQEFHWVMKKMVPNANGAAISFASDAEQTITQSFTFPGNYRLPNDAQPANIINLSTEHSVENFNELLGVVFIQNETTKEVVQSEWTVNNPWDYYASVNEQKIESLNISMYPNPASQSVTINTEKITSNTTVKVIDIAGKVVAAVEAAPGMETAIDCAALSNGIYLVQFEVNGTTATQKLVINK
ncbi:MAG: T9SS type A sorting domain-containing protein [Bacteroidia bacterium]|nr:T9SS type A sorting domain-containing protein [Bacteroidia bacterium]